MMDLVRTVESLLGSLVQSLNTTSIITLEIYWNKLEDIKKILHEFAKICKFFLFLIIL